MQMRRDRNREGLQELQDKLAAEAESTVFGEVEEGLDVVEMIQGTATGRADRPVDDIEMKMIAIE